MAGFFNTKNLCFQFMFAFYYKNCSKFNQILSESLYSGIAEIKRNKEAIFLFQIIALPYQIRSECCTAWYNIQHLLCLIKPHKKYNYPAHTSQKIIISYFKILFRRAFCATRYNYINKLFYYLGFEKAGNFFVTKLINRFNRQQKVF